MDGDGEDGDLKVCDGSQMQSTIDKCYDGLMNVDGNGKVVPCVCSICDEFIMKKRDLETTSVKKMKDYEDLLTFEWLPEEERLHDVETGYTFPEHVEGNNSWLNDYGLSPRGSLYRASPRHAAGFTCCSSCKSSLRKGVVPRCAITNLNHVGMAPECLRELTEVEMAFLSPVRSYGYCFLWEGGAMRCMKGTLVFMRVKERQVAKAVSTLKCMGLNRHVVVLISGKLTAAQKRSVLSKTEIRTEKLIAAVEWLVENNKAWKEVDLEELREEIATSKPIVVDKSSNIGSGNANVEEEEVFTCYYPDSASDSVSGGFDTPGAFKEFVTEMQEKNYDLQFKAQLEKEFVRGGDDEILLGAALLQFPYGVGGLDESRLIEKGERSNKTDLSDFLIHLSKKSAPEFQTALFQLIMYSLKSKARLLKTSRLQFRNKTDAKNLAEGFNYNDLNAAIKGRKEGNYHAGTNVARKLLKAIDACSKSLPHTRDAAKTARSSMEALQHHFGSGSLFLTVTPDDENSFLIQVLTGDHVDDDRDICDLSDDELSKRSRQRQELRFKYPGAAAINFEMLLDIVMEEVIGWNRELHSSKVGGGLFGEVIALAMAVEEQGRKTLHAHFVLWVKGYNKVKERVFFGKDDDRVEAIGVLQEYCDHLATTSLFPTEARQLKKAFDHDGCSISSYYERDPPSVIGNQSLRLFRHRVASKEGNGVFAFCNHCDKTWTYENLWSDYLVNLEDIRDKVTVTEALEESANRTGGRSTSEGTEEERDTDAEMKRVSKARLMAEIVSYQRPDTGRTDCPSACISAVYQAHASCHAKSCFRCMKLTGTKKRKHQCSEKCECRFRLPDKKRTKTTVKTENQGVAWYHWNGSSREQPLVCIYPKRNTYDLFQNVCCKCLSNSKFSCNTNISLITDGPIAYYICKYCVKANDKDEVADYTEVDYTMKKMTGRVHEENDRAEALRIICRAAFAHNKSNVISATLASYLTRNDSRFYFSHDFSFCPLTDLVRIHNKQRIDAQLAFDPKGMTYFENQSLHYLCRPKQVENVCLKDFFEQYEVKYCSNSKKKNKDNPVIPFLVDTGFFKHPSVVTKKSKNVEVSTARQGIRLLEERRYVKVPQWVFPDSCDFHGDILTCADADINEAMEVYAQAVLTLLMPHRTKSDLQVNSADYPHAKKLREIFEEDQCLKESGEDPMVFTEQNMCFLQNLQDASSNAIRYKPGKDNLQSCTDPYLPDGVELPDQDDSDNEIEPDAEFGCEDLLEELGQTLNVPYTDNDPEYLFEEMESFRFTNLRNKGEKNCGWKRDMEPITVTEPLQDFVRMSVNESASTGNGLNDDIPEQKREYTVKEITQVLMKRTTVAQRNVWEDKDTSVSDATGTIQSIREWGKAGFGKDRKQRRAFECIIASFLLTFYEAETSYESSSDPTISVTDRVRYRKSRSALLKLKGNKDLQLICLLHGPGGSGKSAVLNMVKAHAKSYCQSLGHEYTHRTIVTTAMSGVAATLLHGETAHMALHMNKGKIPAEEIKNWQDARLIIIDEISFASPDEFERIHECLKVLMNKRYKLYGGANIVFAGDYSQLEPVAKPNTVYTVPDLYEFHSALNSFIELNGRHRFKDDPAWGDVLFRFRCGEPTLDDINRINEKCHVRNKKPPSNIQIATHANKNRDAINAAVFEEWCKKNKPADGSVLNGAVVVLMDDLQMTDSKKSYVSVKSNQVKRNFYENCGENDCKLPEKARGRVDPMLKLYPGCPMMHTKNTKVIEGQANGSRVRVRRIDVKVGESPSILVLDCGTKVRAFLASQIDGIIVEHEAKDISPRQFRVEIDNWAFSTELKCGIEEMNVKMKGKQFPIISNSCTTGHKLQGCTVESVLINDFNCTKNWPCVVLSRVKTMDGLYLREKLSTDLKKYKMSNAMKAMLQRFRDELDLDEIPDDVCESLIASELGDFED